GAVRVDSVTQAVRLAVERSLSLQAADAGRQASLGDQRQAGVMPNPELSIEAENFAGSGAYRGTRSLETTFGISQRLEIGG
ncbi:TolC family protein, partial [Acinetobacter baumannii]